MVYKCSSRNFVYNSIDVNDVGGNDVRVLVAVLAIIAGLALISLRKKFGARTVAQRNVLGRANAAAADGSLRA